MLKIARNFGLLFLVISLLGCASFQGQDYIKADHPYVRKVSGDFDKIVSAVKLALGEEGFMIKSEVNSSDYERRDGGEDQSKDVLLFTEYKRHSKILYSTYVHWNIYIHPTADGAELDLRYESFTPRPIKPSVTNNPKAASRLLDKIEQLVER
jgi:hypothetical protein